MYIIMIRTYVCMYVNTSLPSCVVQGMGLCVYRLHHAPDCLCAVPAPPIWSVLYCGDIELTA